MILLVTQAFCDPGGYLQKQNSSKPNGQGKSSACRVFTSTVVPVNRPRKVTAQDTRFWAYSQTVVMLQFYQVEQP